MRRVLPMSMQGPIVVVAGKRSGGLSGAFASAGSYPVVETSWAGAATAISEINPCAVVLAEPDPPDLETATALAATIDQACPFLPVIAPEHLAPYFAGAYPVPSDAPIERLAARLAGGLRLRSLHATVLRRGETLRSERNIVAELPPGDPLDDATVLVMGRGRSHPELTVAVGERVGMMGALSVEAAARCLNARDIEGIAIGDGLPARALEAFLTLLAEDSRFRDLPVAALGAGETPQNLPNFVRAGDAASLTLRILPLVRLRAFEARLKRLLHSIERKGMLDVRTGLMLPDAFGHDLDRAIEDASRRGSGLSVARFGFAPALAGRPSMDAARLVARLVRATDFACRQDDGSILAAFTETDLRHAHVVARRLAAVIRHTVLREGGVGPGPDVTLATLTPSDTALTLLTRVAPRPVAEAAKRA